MAPKKAPDAPEEEEEKPVTWEDNLGAAEVTQSPLANHPCNNNAF